MDRDYASRKFIVTMYSITGAFVLAYFKLLTGDVAMIVAAAIASYNWANVRANGGSK
jgi:hypothetical protein